MIIVKFKHGWRYTIGLLIVGCLSPFKHDDFSVNLKLINIKSMAALERQGQRIFRRYHVNLPPACSCLFVVFCYRFFIGRNLNDAVPK